ncbi:hypothetical protein [Absicoccus intestinalis]|uniref:Uncharacterized protein n=1 Tax=Absicoccus intestinalis TaxID=2926319 RepID=A0ABU4WLD9_9FIRM|nr:hypothetical protein [Absicoccus sp. CLA-KB-P134]MDX8417365.1 hypothetical protein [Absicoccus sp. CLA-KB-P134]
MELKRKQFVSGMVKLLGNGHFRYGAYKSQPTTPYGMYMRTGSDNFTLDDKVCVKIDDYEIRLVTDEKNFELESKIEAILDSLEIPYDVIMEEDIQSEKVHVVEWAVRFGYER